MRIALLLLCRSHVLLRLRRRYRLLLRRDHDMKRPMGYPILTSVRATGTIVGTQRHRKYRLTQRGAHAITSVPAEAVVVGDRTGMPQAE